MSPNPKVAVVGVGEAIGGRATGKTTIQLYAEAFADLLADCPIDPAEIDGVLTSSPDAEPHHMFSTWLTEYLGLRPKFTSAVQMGGATPHSNMALATALVESGRCQMVMVADGDNRATKFSRTDKVQAMSSQVGHLGSIEPPNEFDGPFGPTAPALYGLMATRHMYEYGTTPEQFARIAVAFRNHGALNERAQLRKPVTVEDVLASPVIAWPLHRDECALISDWGSAILVTTAERADALRSDSPYLLGLGQAHQGYNSYQAPSLTTFPIRESTDEAFDAAGISRDEVDVLELYDSFTSTAMITLEDMGFCGAGEGGAFVEAGNIDLGGSLPTNTHGGLLSYNGGHGHFIVEATRQLRGECGERQVPNAKIAVSQGTAALASSSITLVLGR
jgi:acetyl-CoA acetyltransferase